MRAARCCARGHIWPDWGAYRLPRSDQKCPPAPSPPLQVTNTLFARSGQPPRLPRRGWRRRWMAARRLTTISHPLSMLPPAPCVVGSSRRGPGTPRADADQGAGRWAASWAGARSGGCECLQGCAVGGIDPCGVSMKPANHRSTDMHPSPRILPPGHGGDPRPSLTSSERESCKPRA